MAKHKNNHRNSVPIGGPFTPIRHEEHDSQAYCDLTGSASKLYGYIVRVARTVAHKLGSDEWSVDFDYTYSESVRRGFSTSTFKRAIKELWQHGFISVVQIGGRTASEDRGRMPSKYKLSKLWKTYGNTWSDRTQHEPDPWRVLSEPKKSDASRW